MKALLVVMATMLFSSQSESEIIGQTQLTDSFTDLVKSVSEDNNALIVSFHRHSASYRIAVDHPQFTEIRSKLEKAQKIAQKIKVIAIIPSMTIREITA